MPPVQPTQHHSLADAGWTMLRAYPEPPSRFKVMGERASGTNFMTAVMKRNTPARRVGHFDYGWKHGFPAMIAIARSDLIVVSFRNAIDWIQSLYARPWASAPEMHGLDFSAFIRAEWRSETQFPKAWFGLTPTQIYRDLPLQMDRDPISGRPFANAIRMRNRKVAAWLGLLNRESNVTLARYEAVRDAPERFLGDLGEAYGFAPPAEAALPTPRLGQGYTVLDIEARKAAARDISEADRQFILGELDLEQERALGYDYGA